MENKLRGHDIVFENGEWLYADTKTPTINNERECGKCGKGNTSEDHDWCIANLHGVMNACCGHGVESAAHIQYLDGSCIEGEEAFKKMGICLESKKDSSNADMV